MDASSERRREREVKGRERSKERVRKSETGEHAREPGGRTLCVVSVGGACTEREKETREREREGTAERLRRGQRSN